MMKLNGWKMAYAILVLYAGTAIGARAQVFESLVGFDGADGNSPQASVVQGTDGNLYGTTNGNGGDGTVFKITRQGVLETIYRFCAQPHCSDGIGTFAGLTLGTDGAFYGTTYNGGSLYAACGEIGCGTIFKITSAGVLTTLHSFNPYTEGFYPQGNLIRALDGNFYGTTIGGSGTVFKVTPEGTFTTLYTFCALENCADGVNPTSGLIQATDGNFYGTTGYGGLDHKGCYDGCGTVFEIAPGGTLVTLHTFDATDGGNPTAPLIQATDGKLYGTTSGAGLHGMGTVFSITPKGRLTTIHDFCALSNCADGATPFAGLIQGTDGNLYGTSSAGGANQGESCVESGCGTAFSITPEDTLTTLYNFCSQSYDNCTDGASPRYGLFQATNGTFYGTTPLGGYGGGYGTVFSLSMGLEAFVKLEVYAGKIGQTGGILGQGFTGTTSVSINGTPASFTVISDTFLKTTVPHGATSGLVTVVTPGGTLTSDKPFQVIP